DGADAVDEDAVEPHRRIIRHVANVLRDSYGTVADDLRISVTDRCNFRCIYCMPAEGLRSLSRQDIRRSEELTALPRLFDRRYGVARAMEGIHGAQDAGLRAIKLNMVVLKGKNDDEVVDFARLAREKGYDVRFIEFMPLDGDEIWSNDLVVPSRRIQEQIEDQFPLVPAPTDRPGPCTTSRFDADAQRSVGFISSVSRA